MKIRPVEVEMLHADKRRTYRRTDQLNGANTVATFHKFLQTRQISNGRPK